jgi:hypothetical protein
MDNSNFLSAQVVLKPTSAAAAQPVMDAFRQAGFAVGDRVANNFSITAPVATFENYFRVQLEAALRSAAHELPLDALPRQIRNEIARVLFSAPIDFGPGAHF